MVSELAGMVVVSFRIQRVSARALRIVPSRSPEDPIIGTVQTFIATPDQILDEARELGDAERFGEKGTGAGVEGRLTHFPRRKGRNGDHGRAQGEPLSSPDDVEPVAVRQPEVGDDEPRPHAFQQPHPLGTRGSPHHPVPRAAEQSLVGRPHVRLILNDQDLVHVSQVRPAGSGARAYARRMSVSVRMPIRCSPSSTGRAPILCSSMSSAAARASWSGPVMITLLVMTSPTVSRASRWLTSHTERLVACEGRFRRMSRSVTMPTMRPPSVTSRCRMRSFSMVCRASNTPVPRLTVMGAPVMSSRTFM